MMDEATAIELARKFLSKNIELKVHPKTPEGVAIYQYNPKDEILISFSLLDEYAIIGTSKYISVSKFNGTVKYVGQH